MAFHVAFLLMLSYSFLVSNVPNQWRVIVGLREFYFQFNVSSAFDETLDMLVAIIKLVYILFLGVCCPTIR